MKKVTATLTAGLFACAAFAQAFAATSQAEPAKAEASQPVKSTLKPEPDVAGATATDAKAAGEAKKVEKHKKAKAHKKAAKSETAAGAKTEPAAEAK
jgi:hypothetical protein